MSATKLHPNSLNDQQYAEFGETRFGGVSPSKVARIRQDAGQTILDVGCASGQYVKALNDLGFDVTGVDANPFFVKEASKTGASVLRVDLETEELSRFGDATFDSVLMLDILEHVHNDAQLLKDARRVCRKNVIVTVPTRMTQAFDGSQLIFGSYLDPTHLRYYNDAELARLFSEAGFESYKIEVGLRFDPVLYKLFPNLVQYPLSIINRALLKFSNPKLFATVWYAVGRK